MMNLNEVALTRWWEPHTLPLFIKLVVWCKPAYQRNTVTRRWPCW